MLIESEFCGRTLELCISISECFKVQIFTSVGVKHMFDASTIVRQLISTLILKGLHEMKYPYLKPQVCSFIIDGILFIIRSMLSNGANFITLR